MAPSLRPWFLYLLECSGGSYYAGITTDVQARFQAAGCASTRSDPVLYSLPGPAPVEAGSVGGQAAQ